MSINVQQIKDLLDKPASANLSNDTITANLDRSKRFVDNVADPNAHSDDIEDAKRAMCVWLCYGSYMEGITQLMGAISVADKTKLDHLRGIAELYINSVSISPVTLSSDGTAMAMEQEIGIDPSVFKLTTTETYSQNG